MLNLANGCNKIPEFLRADTFYNCSFFFLSNIFLIFGPHAVKCVWLKVNQSKTAAQQQQKKGSWNQAHLFSLFSLLHGSTHSLEVHAITAMVFA